MHYQTAYKWVRDGELTAAYRRSVRRTAGCAVAQFQAEPAGRSHRRFRTKRSSALRSHGRRCSNNSRRWGPTHSSAVPSSRHFARSGAKRLGDLCSAVRIDDEGTIDFCAVDHPHPTTPRFVAGALHVTAMLGVVVRNHIYSGTVLRIWLDHVPQDQLLTIVSPAMRQHSVAFLIHSLLASPIAIAGTPGGVLVFTRDSPGAPYTDTDEQFAIRMSTRIGALFENCARSSRHGPLAASLPHSATLATAASAPCRHPLSWRHSSRAAPRRRGLTYRVKHQTQSASEAMMSSVIEGGHTGLRYTARNTVSPCHVVGITNARWSCNIFMDHS